MIKKHNLNFDWQFMPSFKESFLGERLDESGFTTVDLPHTVKELPLNNFDEESYQFVSVYRKSVEVSAEMLTQRLRLEFEGVAVFAEVYVNGVLAFSHKGAYTAFGGEINEFLRVGKNVVAVKLDSTERPEIPPFGGQVDYLVYGGMYREAWLYECSDGEVERVFAYTTGIVSGTPRLYVKVRLNNGTDGIAVALVLRDSEGNEVVSATVCSGETFTAIEVPDAKPWGLDAPNLYRLSAKPAGSDGDEECDGVNSVRVGFREAEFKRNGFYLNGTRVVIRGLNRHQSYPYVGYAMPASAQRADAELLKCHLGVNLVRTSHYPNSRHFLNRCDELGLLVFTEIPGWQHVSKLPEWRGLVLDSVREMIEQDFNHASIVLWGVRINESGDDDGLYTTTNALARKLDTSRQTGGVRVLPFSHLLEDVYTFNDFSHKGGRLVLMPKPFTGALGKPLLVTEHNGHMFPTKSFDKEGVRQEHALRHARVLNKVYKGKARAGAIGWCMSDYNTHKDFGSGDRVCYHGVTDIFRIDKSAAWAYASQQDKIPFLKCGSNLEIGDHPGGMIGRVYFFTNCETITVYKNGERIGEIDVKKEAKKREFKHLPHPPVPFDDQLGDQLIKKEGFSVRKSNTIKRVFKAIYKYGAFSGAVRRLFSVFKILVFYRLGVGKIIELFGKYASTWGGKSSGYRFEGLIAGKVVAESVSASVFCPRLEIIADKDNLVEADTYDVTRITLRALSEVGNVLPYCNEVVSVAADEGLEVIGAKTFALIGGQRAFWVRTKGRSGVFNISINSSIGSGTVTIKGVKECII